MPAASPRRSALLTLCYLPLLGILALAFERNDRDVRWHARNGLALFGAVAALGLAATLVSLVFPSIGCVYGVVMLVALVVYTLVTILAVVKALQGERLIVPGVSRYAG